MFKKHALQMAFGRTCIRSVDFNVRAYTWISLIENYLANGIKVSIIDFGLYSHEFKSSWTSTIIHMKSEKE